ncbi:unnamed protein product [Ceutorhynchus assimilis]|uniref:Uncharacterized protein n=1 Tax=Ceutorhynchus assimilis TaxID=467358 RepID=A0A9N9QGR7_9CUCU|nr:unnamed protein product [Ceutorhynchus assimilis]
MTGCFCVDVLLSHINGKKQFTDFTSEELNMIPLDYLIKNANTFELLEIWSKLPPDYKSDFSLQIRLPCFFHYNRADWRTHIDGPVSSQQECYFCNKVLK